MKIIAFSRPIDGPVTMPPVVDIMPDSAITVANRPLFLPDFSTEWKGTLAPAFRISRLGKEIGRKFASRYYDAMTLALRITPVNYSPAQSGIYCGFDSCVTLGEWIALEEGAVDIDVEFAGIKLSVTAERLEIDRAIEAVSHYCTLKTGDIVMPCVLPPPFAVVADTPVEASLNGHQIAIKVK